MSIKITNDFILFRLKYLINLYMYYTKAVLAAFLKIRPIYYTNLYIYLNVRNSFLDLKIVIIFCISFASKVMHAQLGFCQGNSGDPIFSETFGSGTNYGPALSAGTTTYDFISSSGPQDGEYSIARNTFSYGWNLPSDHTGDTNGKALIVNASFTTGEFYNIAVSGLCENTTYEFSSWLINILPSSGCGGSGIPVNVQFEIWDITNTNLLASGDTGNIYGSSTPNWQQYGLVFQTLPSQTAIILKMINNGAGGCGNDLAIDDIIFKSCGDLISTEDSGTSESTTICSSQTPFSDTITAVPDNAVFSTHFYQWQVSTDGFNWSNVSGETNAAIMVSGITSTTYYRTKVSEYEANLDNSDCITFSDVYEITVNQAPPSPTTACWETATFIEATCSWDITGTQPSAPTGLECWQTANFNTTTCSWDILGLQPTQPTTECWETATFNATTCSWEISGTQEVQPTIECWQIAIFDTTTCSWNITGIQPESPSGLACWETSTFNNDVCLWEVTGTQPVLPDLECWETASFNTTTCQWDILGTQPQEPTNLGCWQTANFNIVTCTWDISGVEPQEPTDLECWQTTVFDEDNCEWEIVGTQPLEYSDEFFYLCENDELTLEALSSIYNPTYQWVSGEMSQSITIDSAGIYEVEITDGCYTEIITFNVTLIENPVIENVVSEGSSIIVNLSTVGDYLYSLNGVDYQFNNVFSNQQSGLYTIYVKSNECDVVETGEHLHFFIFKFITPNADGDNDFFSLNVSQYFTSTEVYIFDRYGKLLFSAINRNVNWDGTFNNTKLPTSDYWYRIVIDGKEFKGHFALKR